MARLHLLYLLVIVLSVSHSSSQGPPPPQLKANAQAFLDAHNTARAEVGVQPLNWSATLETDASLVFQYRSSQQQHCMIPNLSGTGYGMNLIWTTGPLVSPQEAVTSWVAAKKYFNYANKSCLAGQQCGGYAQVVWKKFQELGCAQGLCADNSDLTICIYKEPGNTGGEKPW